MITALSPAKEAWNFGHSSCDLIVVLVVSKNEQGDNHYTTSPILSAEQDETLGAELECHSSTMTHETSIAPNSTIETTPPQALGRGSCKLLLLLLTVMLTLQQYWLCS